MKPITYVMPSNKHYAHEYPVKEHSKVDLIIFNDKMIKQYKEGKIDVKPITYAMPSNKHYAHEYPVKEHSKVDLIIFNDKMIKQYKEGKIDVKLLVDIKKSN